MRELLQQLFELVFISWFRHGTYVTLVFWVIFAFSACSSWFVCLFSSPKYNGFVPGQKIKFEIGRAHV